MKKNLLALLCGFILLNYTVAQMVIPLYNDAIPNSRPVADNEDTTYTDGIMLIDKITRPTLSIFLPDKKMANGTAVIICPGGGYSIVAAGHEGADVAKAFAATGVAAFVLKYRIPNDKTMIDKTIGPLQDAQQAIKIVREGAAAWHINPNRIGIMGFSAGGHLAATAGTQYTRITISNPKNTSLRPDFMVLIYPVISFTDSIGHKGSANALLGANPNDDKIKAYSNELQVTAKTPPTFLVHASDDDAVVPQNSIRFYEALIKYNVPAELHIYQYGGHGFGLNINNSSEKWMDRCITWMTNNGWMKQD